MLVEGIEHLSFAELTSRFRAGQKPTDTDWATIRPAVRKRQSLMAGIYPYFADDEGVGRNPEIDGRIYDFLLLASLERAPFRVHRQFNPFNRVFDLLVREALKAHLGEGSEGVRFGTPVNDGRPEDFPEAVTWLAGLMGVAEIGMDRPADANDAGTDVVAWKHLADRRAGFSVILAQATLEMNWVHKATEILVDGWKQWLDIGHPILALAVPFAVPENDTRWLVVRYSAAIPLDRVRICSLLRNVDLRQFEEWAELATLVSDQIAAVMSGVGDGDEEGRPNVPRRRKERRTTAHNPLSR